MIDFGSDSYQTFGVANGAPRLAAQDAHTHFEPISVITAQGCFHLRIVDNGMIRAKAFPWFRQLITSGAFTMTGSGVGHSNPPIGLD